jgi:glycosyltransferase involved in cell wall biosynthesis
MASRRSVLLNGPTTELTSFSLVNRRLVEGLERAGYDVWPGDAVSSHDLPDVCLTHGHPLDAFNAPGRVNAFFLEYDYARFLRTDRFVTEGLNSRFDLCIAPSRFVRDACLASGVEIPVAVCPLGVDFAEFGPEIPPAPLPTDRRFTFVYVGGATERKGVDVLVEAFRAEFTADDDAALVLKTHGYDHLLPWLEGILGPADSAGPEIAHIHGPARSVAGYYTAADVGVFPFRGEAFALPILECLASGTPVIVTRGGGPADFCTPENAAFVRSRKKTLGGKKYLEPDGAHLARLMREAYERRGEVRDPARIRETVAAFTWERTVTALVEAIESCIARKRPAAKPTATVAHAFGEIGATSWKKVAGHVDAALRSRFDTVSLDRRARILEAAPRLVVGESGFALEYFAAARRSDPRARTVLICGNGPFERVLETTNRERTLCGLEPVRPAPVKVWRERQEERLADIVVVHSRASARGFVERGRADETIAVVPLGFTASRPRPRPRPRSDTLRFLFVGTDPFRKGIRVLLSAWDALRPRRAELHCLVNTEALGSKHLLKYLVRNSNVVVKPLVPRHQLERIYDEADCQILPSFEDGFAVAVADGMGRGLPAIVSTETGVADLLAHERDGLIVETGSVEMLRDAIARLCDNPAELDRMGAEAFQTARRRPWSLFERELGDVAEALLR